MPGSAVTRPPASRGAARPSWFGRCVFFFGFVWVCGFEVGPAVEEAKARSNKPQAAAEVQLVAAGGAVTYLFSLCPCLFVCLFGLYHVAMTVWNQRGLWSRDSWL
jgi:hypothetical protein